MGAYLVLTVLDREDRRVSRRMYRLKSATSVADLTDSFKPVNDNVTVNHEAEGAKIIDMVFAKEEVAVAA